MIDNMAFVQHTKSTIMNPADLRINLTLTRQRGYAIDANETHEGLTCVARPIFNADNVPIASIGITCVTALVSGDPGKFEHIIESIQAIGAELTTQLAD